MHNASDDPASVRSVRRLHPGDALRARGAGRVAVDLQGGGRLTVHRGRYDDMEFRGRGVPRHLSATCIQLSGAVGMLVLEGTELDLEFVGVRAWVLFEGEFDLPPDPRAGGRAPSSAARSRAAPAEGETGIGS